MAITIRSVKGSNLTPTEVDNNFLEVQSLASTAQDTADLAQTNIDSVETIANTALSTANSAQTLAGNAVPLVAGSRLITNIEGSKLAGIATGATLNDTDANLKNRANHTGTQAATTIVEDSTHRFSTDTEKIANITGNSQASVLTGSLQPETLDYLYKIKAVSGGGIDFFTLSQVDKAITEIKRVGAYTKLKRLSFASGINLASALVHVVGQMTNTGFVEADFTQDKGFSLTSNSGKSLDTGLIPTAEGLSNTNFSFGIMVLDEQTTNSPAAIFSDSPASGASALSLQDKSFGIGSAGAAVFGGGVEFISASYGSNIYGFFINGYKLYGNTTTIAATLNSELKLFRGTFNGAPVYSKTSLGSYFVGEYLTDVQIKAVSNALKAYEEAIGRVSTVGGKVTFEGDSNTAGKGITNPSDITSSQVGKAIGFRVENLGSSGSQLRQDTPTLSAIGLFTGYRDITKTKRNIHVMMPGTNDRNIGDLTTDGNTTVISDFINKYGVIVSVFKAEGNKVVIVSPPGDASGASKVKQQAYVDACATVANSRSVVLVDIYNYMLDATATGALSELIPLFLQNDNLHLSTAGHAYLVYPIALGIQGRVVRNPTFDFPEVAAGGIQEITVTMPSVKIGADIEITNVPVTGLIFQAYCATDGVVTMRATNLTAAAINPAAMKIKIVANAL